MDMTLEQLEDLRDADDDVKAEFCRVYLPFCQSESEFHAALEGAIKALKLLETDPGDSPNE